jgi:hypothetical protein
MSDLQTITYFLDKPIDYWLKLNKKYKRLKKENGVLVNSYINLVATKLKERDTMEQQLGGSWIWHPINPGDDK